MTEDVGGETHEDQGEQRDRPAIDPRFQLANERTLLAWMRTSLGLLAGAVAVSSPVSRLSDPARASLGLWLVAVSALTGFVGWTRWRRTRRALEDNTELPGATSVGWVVAAFAITVLTVMVAIITETIL